MIVNKGSRINQVTRHRRWRARLKRLRETLGDPRRPEKAENQQCREFISIPYSRVLTCRPIMTTSSLERESKRDRRDCCYSLMNSFRQSIGRPLTRREPLSVDAAEIVYKLVLERLYGFLPSVSQCRSVREW
jgi:hypothetical protein